jgi:L-seryl-tRNA(Ser) seleniumtransferase
MTDLRSLPSVDKLLLPAQTLVSQYGREPVVSAIRGVLERVRSQIRAGERVSVEADALLEQAENQLKARFRPTLRPVINATGVIIHTNLGRAPLSAAAQQAMIEAAAGYSTLEYDLQAGQRGSRLIHADKLLQEITGAEAALVVNNNAAATVLLLAGLAQGREVIVSRGQLVEIGGGFRVPDIMSQSGAKLVEVGTTNRTRAADYERAISENTALLMRIHASNFRQIGFTESTPPDALAEIAHRHGLYAVDDLGSGALLDTAPFGLEHEPTAQESIAAGMDIAAFSGDKLLGGPQAGILIGKRELVDRLKRHPLARAVRADKLCLAALTATLDHYRKGEALTRIPVWQMISRSLDDIRHTAERWRLQLSTDALDVIPGDSTVGGGSLPGGTLPTMLLRVRVNRPDDFAALLRQMETPVIARIAEGAVLFDPRTVLPTQEASLLTGIREVLTHASHRPVG